MQGPRIGGNMLIWIDGTYGVGKSHVAEKLAEHLSNKAAEYIESDHYWMTLIHNNPSVSFSGFFPYCNKPFLSIFRSMLEEKIEKFGKTPIVSMSLTDKLCQEELLDYFQNKKITMLHIILEANLETIISRIENDSIRDMNLQDQQKSNLSVQIQYLREEYPDAIRINTENKSIDEVVIEILSFL